LSKVYRGTAAVVDRMSIDGRYSAVLAAIPNVVDYDQQYLAKNQDGYCGLKGTGVSCPIGGNVVAPAH
jgi:hypothetical protein